MRAVCCTMSSNELVSMAASGRPTAVASSGIPSSNAPVAIPGEEMRTSTDDIESCGGLELGPPSRRERSIRAGSLARMIVFGSS
jgi:hypothetical protein